MWFLGLLLGAALGSAFGVYGVLPGALLGLVLGAQWGRERGSVPLAANEQRLRTLEAQVDWLHRESQALRAELAQVRGETTPTARENSSATPAEAPPDVSAGASSAMSSVAPAPVPAPPLAPAVEGGAAKSVAREIPPAWRNAEAACPDAEISVAPGEAEAPAWWSRLLGGNLLARIGVVMLFFGIASGLRLAAEHGLMPVPLRLLLGALAGMGMIVFGWTRAAASAAKTQRMFGLAVQGGGFAILYLLVYFMLARYALLGGTAAFALFALLGVFCVLLAARQDGESLAVFGIAGAFLAPVLAASGGGDPRLLFGYFALLNAFILGVGWFRSWRALNVAGFVLTLVVGMAWAIDQYRPQHYALMQGFLILFCLMYSAASPLTALLRAPGWKGWGEGILVFGTPLAGSFLQAALLGDDRYGLAVSALAAGLYYLAWWLPLYRRSGPEIRLLERSHLGIAVALLMLAVPLAFGAQVTSALWAVEGVAVLWFGARQARRLAQAAGTAMQLAAGLYFLDGMDELTQAPPVFNDVCLGGLLIAAAGFVGARLLRGLARPLLSPALLLGWALLWWFGTGWSEIDRFAPSAMHLPLLLLFAALSCAALEVHGAASDWPAPRAAAALLLPLLALVAFAAVARHGHALAGTLLVVWPSALALQYWILGRQEQPGPALFGALRHVAGWWLIVAIAGAELAWVGQRLAPGVTLWPLLGWGVVAAVGLHLADFGARRGLRPFSAQPAAYRGAACLPLALAAAIWSLFANSTHAGGGSGLPYLPLFNPFDLTQLFVLGALASWLGKLREDPLPGLPAIAGVTAWPAFLGFVWLSMLAARIAHHWGGVSFEASALFHSSLLQGMLTLLWSAAAIGLMIRATRQGRRQGWYGGFALLAVVGAKLLAVDLANAGTAMWTGSLIGVALLVLAAGYFAPVPPKEGETG